MIFIDVTKTDAAAHRSGLMRVTTRLVDELGAAATKVSWPDWPRSPRPDDWFVTAELFSEPERPGFTEFLDRKPCRMAAIFHDAIPLKHPHITWPQSVARHPGYMKLLAKFDRIWAVSRSSQEELEGFWRWQGLARTPAVEVLPLGADFTAAPRVTSATLAPRAAPELLCLGILEPRKNQRFLLEACEPLWREGVALTLNVVGRENPHFGRPIVDRMKELARQYRGAVTWHEGIDDATLARLYATARTTVFPTIAEGCGLPLLESLWMGVPCVCSDLPVLRENAAGGGCVPVAVNDASAWTETLRRVLTDDAFVVRLAREATTRPLPTWAAAAAAVRAAAEGK